MRYIPMPTDVAEKLSRELYHLTQPVAIRDPANITTHFYGWHIKKTDPTQCVVEMPDADSIPVHPASDTAEFVKLLNTSGIAGPERAALVKVITDNKNKRIDPNAVLPASWKAAAITKEQAIAGGFLPNPAKPL